MHRGLVVILKVALVIFLTEGAFMLVLPLLGLPSNVWVNAFVDATALTLIGGVCIYFFVIKPYIDARDKSERKLRENETLHAIILDNMPAPIGLKSVDGRYLFVNKIFAERRGMSVDEIRGNTASDLWPKEIAENLEAEDRELIRTGSSIESETDSLGVDGKLRHYRGIKFPVFGEDGNIVATGSVHTDITKQKDIEEEVARQSAVLSALIDALPAHVSLRDREGRFIFVNRTMAEDYGRDVSEFVGRNLNQISMSIDAPTLQAMAEEVLKTGKPIVNREFNPPRFPGRTFLSNIMPLRQEDGVLAISLDITELKRSEQALRESEARFSGVLEIAPDAIITADAHGNVQMFNQRARNIFGYEEDEILGRSLEMLIPKRFRNGHVQNIAGFVASGAQSQRMSERNGIFGLRKDGSEFPAEASVSKFEAGDERFFSVILRDVTERKRIEREIIQSKELAEAASRAKSEFLANMSHELRTPLNAILGFSEVMTRETFGPLGSKKYNEYAADIHNSGSLLLDLISDVLDLSKIEAGALDLTEGVVDLNEAVRSVLRMGQERAARKSLHIDTNLDPTLPAIRGDERAIKQIVLNLLSNCTKFTAEGGAITFSSEIDPDGGVSLIVTDTGIGIAHADIPKVLEPFGQVGSPHTRGYEGTGLGLPLAKRLTEMHDAIFELESEPGVGTTVRLRFPPERIIRADHNRPERL
ncbi:MAG: PAS domain S-box protein [Alphaproteobacteria bacterium]|nr:PAS domain S-box protein [Alphaproteobacteria bacterium]MBL6952792.1 PAS domain S-box protein [Alphaproteobacteria bacterium]